MHQFYKFGYSGRSDTLFFGGEGGIRTLDAVSGMPDFESGRFNHSRTSPEGTFGILHYVSGYD